MKLTWKYILPLLFIIYLIWKFHYQDSVNLIATIQQDSLPIQKYSIYQLIRGIRRGKRAFSWSQPFINLSRRGKIFYPEARASCITHLYPSSQKLFTRALARSVYSFREWKDPSMGYRVRRANIRGFNQLSIAMRGPPANPVAEILHFAFVFDMRERASLSKHYRNYVCTHFTFVAVTYRPDLVVSSRRLARVAGRWASLLIPAPRSADENSANTRLCVNSHSVDRLLQPFDGWYNYLARELTMTSRAAVLEALLLKAHFAFVSLYFISTFVSFPSAFFSSCLFFFFSINSARYFSPLF